MRLSASIDSEIEIALDLCEKNPKIDFLFQFIKID
jgi:hypothetical protein